MKLRDLSVCLSCFLGLVSGCRTPLPSQDTYAGNVRERPAQFSDLPQPAHTVVVVLENHGFDAILTGTAAPYLQQLAASGAVFTQSYGLTHPSQPNYLMLFSGSNQGITTDEPPSGTPFSTPNLGAQLLAAGKRFVGYSEDLPAPGFAGPHAGAYASKHSPWVFWQGSGPNQLPPASNLPLSDFPADFSQLPELAFVIPNLDNDMHNGLGAATIQRGDQWLKDHLDAYVQWARSHDSLLVVTFDEDDYIGSNRIATLLVGPMVRPGRYEQVFGHFSLLRTLEELYRLPYAGQSAFVDTLHDCWLTPPAPLQNSVG